jgi:hypothetical protein
MANFIASNLVQAQAKINLKFSQQELRRKQNPALVLALQNLTATIPDQQELRTREDRPVSAYLFKRRGPSNGTARVARPTGARGDTMAAALTWSTFSETFEISFKQADKNIFSLQEMMMNEMLQVAQNMHDRLGTYFLQNLHASRNQLFLAAPAGATWNATTDAYDVASGDSLYFFQKLAAIMKQYYYRGQLDVIADATVFQIAQKLRAQGTQNATNLSFQFDQMNIIETTEVINAAYPGGAAMAMPAGNFAALPWIPKQNRNGYGDFESYTGGYGVMDDPFGTTITSLDEQGNLVTVPLRYALYGYTQASDEQANNGQSQDQLTTFEVSLDVAPTLPPLSGVNESVLIEFGQAV